MRKLATIQRISAVRPIPGADMIEVADVLGWSVVVKKGEFQAGDLAVYFEIDSWLDSSNPAFASFEERFTNWGTKRGMRLKTIKLRKQLSQGLVLKISDFKELTTHRLPFNDLPEGYDVTEILKIEKWEPFEEAHVGNGLNKTAGAGKFPSFIRKTDQERVQNYMNELAKHADETFEVTIKLDGSSMSVYHVGPDSPHYDHIYADTEARRIKRLSFWGRLAHKVKVFFGREEKPSHFVGVCSRNIELPVGEDNNFSTFARENGMLERLAIFGKNIAVQGELIAPTIQQNHENVETFEFHAFDVFDIDKQEYMLPEQARRTVEELGWKYVPVLYRELSLNVFSVEPEDTPRHVVERILGFAEGPGMNKNVKREGVVFKSNQSEFSFKAISNSYLLKKEKQGEK